MNKNQDIKFLKGIGDKTAATYHKVGIYTYGDLMYYYPRDYMEFKDARDAGEDLLNTFCFISATPMKHPLLRKAGRMAVVSATLISGDSRINAVWFHMPYVAKSLRAGERYIFAGTLKKSGSFYSMEQPSIFTPARFEELKNTLQPIYPLTKGLSNNSLRKSIKQVLDINDSDEMIGEMKESEALRDIHFPVDMQALKRAREALVYDEFLMFILRLKMLKEENGRAKNDFAISKRDEVHALIDKLPFELTNAQMKVFKEVEEDLTLDNSMSRLIQGDVGCGKTIVAALACLTVALNGYQCVMMAPTEILASQHLTSFEELISMMGMDIPVCLLTGSMTAAQKRKTYEKIASGDVSIIIGTHALFQEKVIYDKLALVVTDEQHRFGVRQREAMAGKGRAGLPHVLVMSATPIPRTLAIMLYGDLDISVIDEVPARRLPIKNCVVGTGFRKKAYEFIEKEVALGHQAYVICPMVEESEGSDLKDVVSYKEELEANLPAAIKVEYLHGKMKASKKEEIMKDYLDRKIDVLVSTTVIEVGVNVPNATVMMIENSERFGLAQLHQLRGRIGRGDAQSYCIFIDCSESEKSKERLNILNKSNDGFYIAGEDLKLRGPGDFFGVRQSGEMQFKLADIYSDSTVLMKAAGRAEEILKKDPGLNLPENAQIKKRLAYLADASDLTTL
ncbi:MAG: ATP-dependent DNA helicase RecG [Lachnospiraceae bacterium]|nr:ATP-dependent DNA helicase RecG [Lachnospiraceae bacterium]